MTKQTRQRTRGWTPRSASARLTELKAAEGIAVKVSHYRVPVEPAVINGHPVRGATAYALDRFRLGSPSTTGGLTHVMILDQSGFLLAHGLATCRADEEFDHRLGLAVALGRALKELDRNPRPIGERDLLEPGGALVLAADAFAIAGVLFGGHLSSLEDVTLLRKAAQARRPRRASAAAQGVGTGRAVQSVTEVSLRLQGLREDVLAEQARHAREAERLAGAIVDLKRRRAFLAAGVPGDQVELAESVLEVTGPENLRRGRSGDVVRDAIDDLAVGGDRLRKEYLGTKVYAGYEQRSDGCYGTVPRHGSVVFSVGLRMEARERSLTPAETEAAIVYLLALAWGAEA